jgi:hypothetical protein
MENMPTGLAKIGSLVLMKADDKKFNTELQILTQ